MPQPKTTEKIISILITVGAILSVGVLSVLGMLQFSNSLFLCIPVFFLSGFVEGQVYWENVSEVMKSVFDPNYIKRAALRKTLQHLSEQLDQNNIFYKEYLKLAKHIHKQQSDHTDEHHHHAKHALESLNARLETMENFFLLSMEQQKNGIVASTSMEEAAYQLFQQHELAFEQMEKLTQQKSYWKMAGILFSMGAGAGSFFAAISAYQMGLLLLGISMSSIASGAIVALAALGAIGLALNLYQSILELIKKYTLTEMWQNIKEFFTSATWAKRIATFLAVGITLLAIIATAGTYFTLVRNGAGFFPLIKAFTTYIQFAVIIIMAVPMLIYSLVNSSETVSLFMDRFSNFFNAHPAEGEKTVYEKFKEKLTSTWQKENLIQFLNPFRIITPLLSKIFFLAHLVSMSLDSNQFPEKFSSIIAGASNEGLVDLPYIFPELHEAKPFSLTRLSDKHHNHSHVFEDIILFIPHMLGVAWEFILGNMWHYIISKPLHFCFSSAGESPAAITWKATKEKFFGKESSSHAHAHAHAHDPVEPHQFSTAWLIQEAIESCNQHVNSYGPTPSESLSDEELPLLNKKLACISGLAKSLTIYIPLVADQEELNSAAFPPPLLANFSSKVTNFKSEHSKLLGQHRYGFLSKTKSTELLERIEQIAQLAPPQIPAT